MARDESTRVLLPDANVLLLLFVGVWDKSRIQKVKRTEQFTEADFDLMQWAVEQFQQVATTPHILTEVSNLAGLHGEPERTQLFQALARQIPVLSEHHIPAATIIDRPDTVFTRLGLTDAAIIAEATARPLWVLTTDLHLYTHLSRMKVSVVNFNHLRSNRLLVG